MRYLPFLLLPALTATAVVAAPPSWRGVWEWSCPKRTEADLSRVATDAAALGFNALLMAPPAKLIPFMQQECHRHGLRLYYSTVFAGGESAWLQVMTPAERERAAKPPVELFMRGGEPVLPGEVFNSPLPCYARPEVRDFFRQRVRQNAALAVDGLAFDYIGYQNYRRCYCEVCEGKFAAYRAAHPGLDEATVERLVGEQILVDFTNDMAAAARQARPELSLTIHIYPWFAPDPYYGHLADVDYVGQTVSWFFRPHWPLDKVSRLAALVVSRQHLGFPRQQAAPFVGFDPGRPRDYRSSTRIARELRLIEQSGATALQVAELGYLLRKPLVAQAVAECLGGSYRAAPRR